MKIIHLLKKEIKGASLGVQGLGLCSSTAHGVGLTPGQGTRILLHATQFGQKKKERMRLQA